MEFSYIFLVTSIKRLYSALIAFYFLNLFTIVTKQLRSRLKSGRNCHSSRNYGSTELLRNLLPYFLCLDVTATLVLYISSLLILRNQQTFQKSFTSGSLETISQTHQDRVVARHHFSMEAIREKSWDRSVHFKFGDFKKSTNFSKVIDLRLYDSYGNGTKNK